MAPTTASLQPTHGRTHALGNGRQLPISFRVRMASSKGSGESNGWSVGGVSCAGESYDDAPDEPSDVLSPTSFICVSCRVVSCRVVSCRVVSCRAVCQFIVSLECGTRVEEGTVGEEMELRRVT
jgi:hypothetical protein